MLKIQAQDYFTVMSLSCNTPSPEVHMFQRVFGLAADIPFWRVDGGTITSSKTRW
jgi:hypothetical protein